MIAKRLAECGLELNERKTRVVYCKDADRRGSYEHTSFDLGVATSGRVPGWVEAPLVLLDVEFPVGVEVAREVDSAEA